MEKAFNSSLQKREKRGGSLSLVEDTLHTFGWGLKGPGGSNRICSSSSPHLGLHAYILSGEGLREGGGVGTREQDKFAQTFPRTHMHQDVIAAKKKRKSAVPQKTVWTAPRLDR